MMEIASSCGHEAVPDLLPLACLVQNRMREITSVERAMVFLCRCDINTFISVLMQQVNEDATLIYFPYFCGSKPS